MSYRRMLTATLAGALLASSAAFAALPTVNTFTLAPSAVSPVTVTAFTASDSDGTVVGYMITTTSTKPGASDSRWTATPWASYSTTAVGSLTLYAWAKDNANGVSSSRSATTVLVAAHNHDAVYQKKHAQVVVVAKSGGDFSDPVEAVNSIGDASVEKPYLVKVMPGVYDLNSTLAMRPFVDIEGSGVNTTTIKSTLNLPVLVNGAWDSEIRNMSIISGTGDAIVNPGSVRSVAISSQAVGVRLSTFDWHHATIQDVTIDATTGISAFYGTSFSVDGAKIGCSFGPSVGGIVWSTVETIRLKDVDVSSQVGFAGSGSNLSTEIADSNFVVLAGTTPVGIVLPGAEGALLKNVTVDTTGTSGATAVTQGAGVPTRIIGGRLIGTIVPSGWPLYIAGAQLSSALDYPGVRLVNCFDADFIPIPNTPTP